MKFLGIDIGTSSICGVVLDENGDVLFTENRKNDATIAANDALSHMQDVRKILSVCRDIYAAALQKCVFLDAVGFTGQMHGVVFLDEQGNPLSPLYTWQHKIAACPSENGSYAEELSRITGYQVSPGYGTATMYAMAKRQSIPRGARAVCTVHAFVAMQFCNAVRPVLHASDAASFGTFDLKALRFDGAALARAGLDLSLFPDVTAENRMIGETAEGVPVSVAIGDNQASVLGSAPPDCVLVNVGTGSQVSAVADRYIKTSLADVRPYFEGRYLLTGCALAGGYAYSLLEKFFRETFRMFGVTPPGQLYPRMNEAAERVTVFPHTVPRFCGTRQDPAATAFIEGITETNFTPQALTRSVLDGIAEELFDLYSAFSPLLPAPRALVGSGNGIRKNPLLSKLFSDRFCLALHTPLFSEEAALGAALAALAAKTNVSVFSAQRLLRFSSET